MDKINWYTPENKQGMTIEEVLEAVIYRIKLYNEQVPCRENALAITNAEQALMWLEHRTKDRIARGVEGTMKG
jgi:hypothetical protein